MKKALRVIGKTFALIFVGALSTIVCALMFVSSIISLISGLIGLLANCLDNDYGDWLLNKIIKMNRSLGFVYEESDE